MGQKQKKGAVTRSNRTRQNNKTADKNGEPNDSPEIPNRGEIYISEVPGLPRAPK